MILARTHKLLQYRSRRLALAVAGDRKRQAMQTPEFEKSLEELIRLANQDRSTRKSAVREMLRGGVFTCLHLAPKRAVIRFSAFLVSLLLSRHTI
jgi:hypothetical protein